MLNVVCLKKRRISNKCQRFSKIVAVNTKNFFEVAKKKKPGIEIIKKWPHELKKKFLNIEQKYL